LLRKLAHSGTFTLIGVGGAEVQAYADGLKSDWDVAGHAQGATQVKVTFYHYVDGVHRDARRPATIWAVI
jgi:hypothetical protein